MRVPDFLLRKLYVRGSLRELGEGRFQFALHNPLGKATLVAPPKFVINGVRHAPEDVEAGFSLAAVSHERPFVFGKGDRHELTCRGHLLRGGNRIHMVFDTEEFGELELLVEDRIGHPGDELAEWQKPGGEEE